MILQKICFTEKIFKNWTKMILQNKILLRNLKMCELLANGMGNDFFNHVWMPGKI